MRLAGCSWNHSIQIRDNGFETFAYGVRALSLRGILIVRHQKSLGNRDPPKPFSDQEVAVKREGAQRVRVRHRRLVSSFNDQVADIDPKEEYNLVPVRRQIGSFQ